MRFHNDDSLSGPLASYINANISVDAWRCQTATIITQEHL